MAGVPARPGRPRPVRGAAVTSDDHAGLVNAIAAVLPGATWQRCRTHYHRNLLTRVPKSAQPWVSTLVRTIFEQPDPASVRAQHAQVVGALEAKLPQAAAHLDDARDDILAFTAFPREIWRQAWSNNPQERLNKEVRRRTDVVGIFPGRDAIIRLSARAGRAERRMDQSRRYMGLEILAACRKADSRTWERMTLVRLDDNRHPQCNIAGIHTPSLGVPDPRSHTPSRRRAPAIAAAATGRVPMATGK